MADHLAESVADQPSKDRSCEEGEGLVVLALAARLSAAVARLAFEFGCGIKEDDATVVAHAGDTGEFRSFRDQSHGLEHGLLRRSPKTLDDERTYVLHLCLSAVIAEIGPAFCRRTPSLYVSGGGSTREARRTTRSTAPDCSPGRTPTDSLLSAEVLAPHTNRSQSTSSGVGSRRRQPLSAEPSRTTKQRAPYTTTRALAAATDRSLRVVAGARGLRYVDDIRWPVRR